MNRAKSPLGFTLVELLVTLSVAGVLMVSAVASFSKMNNPAQNGAAMLAGFLREARARAISTTSAYTVEPISTNRVIAGFGNTCAEAPSADQSMILDLPTAVSLADITWSICFNSRGFPEDNPTILLVDTHDAAFSVEVFLGGAVRFREESY